MKTWNAVLLLPCALLIACGRTEPPADTAPPPVVDLAAPSPTTTAQATLAGASGSTVKGTMQLTAETGAVIIVGELSGLPAGTEHGFHLHEHGDCSAPDATSAGDHFNPGHVEHGAPTAPTRHLGDLPNINADSQGNATVSARIAGATLRDNGPNDLVGSAFIVHEKRDDYISQPAGDSGARVACGVVQ